MALFKRKNANPPTRETYIQNYNQARSNLLIVAVFTAINLFLFLINPLESRYFLFSASVPYILVTFLYELCGKYPIEWYQANYESEGPFEFLDESLWIVAIVVAVIIIIFYLLCFFLSKNMKNGWLITALVFFSIDTLCLFTILNPSYFIMDIIFHAWVIVILCGGISASNKFQKLPPEEPTVADNANMVNNPHQTTLNGEPVDNEINTDSNQQ